MQNPSCILASLLILAAAGPLAAAQGWRSFADGHAGVHISYPADVFLPRPSEGGSSARVFVSRDGGARFAIGARSSAEGESPAYFRRHLLGTDARYDNLTYGPRGRDWFVLSGYDGDNIYYEKVMFSCGRSVTSVFLISYPIAQRARYDGIVERMEDTFRPARRTPQGRACS